MYTNYFGFDSKPFKPKDPRDYYRNADYDAACADLLRAIRAWQGFLLLTGEAGLGKSLILRRCMAEADDIRFILLGNAHLDFPDILNYLCADLGLRTEEPDPDAQVRLLRDALNAYADRGQAVALLIDDAHHLSKGTLRRLWDFVVSTTVGSSQRLPVVLAGLPELEDKLAQPELRELRESLRVQHRVERLSTLETGLFIAHQIKVAGHAGGDLLSPAVVDRIQHYAQGAPRAIALLCDTVLLFSSLNSERIINAALVDEAAGSCFLGDPADGAEVTNIQPPTGGPPVVKQADSPGSELDFSFDFDLDENFGVDTAVPTFMAPRVEPATPLDDGASDTVNVIGRPALEAEDKGAEATAAQTPVPHEFLELLEEIAAKQERRDVRDREAFRSLRQRYQKWLRDGSSLEAIRCEQRLARLAETQQPVLVALTTTPRGSPEAGGVLCALLMNPNWWLCREIRLRLRSADLLFANEGQTVSLRLLDGRDARPVYLEYRLARPGPGLAGLRLELDLLDHRGLWHAYRSSSDIRLTVPHGSQPDGKTGQQPKIASDEDWFWPDPAPVRGGDAAGLGGLAFTLPLALSEDEARTHRLRAAISAASQALGRGTALTRALLLVADPAQAPARIELVSRPFILLGRYNPGTGASFGDFALGFTPEYARISRLHAVICALGDQLALMAASDQGRTYTACNGQRLERGHWRLLEANDRLEICDLYGLRVTLAWDRNDERGRPDWDSEEPRDKFGRFVLDLVDALHQRDRQANEEETRAKLKKRYLHLTWMQDRVAELNGVGSPGNLLYARFERDDIARRQVVHYYVPKWLSLGSGPDAGLRIAAAGVAPLHVELLFREGMYWIQNLAEPGSVQVGCHALATNEVLALESGDTLTIGAARFEFEAY